MKNIIKELKVTDAIYSNQEVFTKAEESTYISIGKYLESNFYLAQSFEEFLSFLRERSGLIIFSSITKLSEIRNNMIRATNNSLCKDALKNSIIFPIMNDSKVGIELLKQFTPKIYPVYLFCKFKNTEVITIHGYVEKKFRMENIINNLLECFPENDIKQSVFESINTCLFNFQKQDKKEIVDDDFAGNEEEVNTLMIKLQKDVDTGLTILQTNKPNQVKVFGAVNPFKDKPKNRFDNLFGDDTSMLLKDVKFDIKPAIQHNLPSIKETVDEAKASIKESNKPFIPPEPAENDPNACKISFRLHYEERYINRRFNKYDKIDALFNYLDSLGREIYCKPTSTSYRIMYGFPLKYFENKRNSTLSEEGLFPSSVINIEEK